MATVRRRTALQPYNNIRKQSASCMSYKELIRIVGVDPDLGPSSWRKAIDHTADTIVFFQVDLRASIPRMHKSVRICRETNGRLLLPSIYIGDSLLSSSYVKAVIGRAYLADEDDLMKLLEHVGVLENGEEISDQAQDSHAFLPESIEEDLENASPYSALLPDDHEMAYPTPKRIKRTSGDRERETSEEQYNTNNRNPENTVEYSQIGNGGAAELTNLFILTTAPIDHARSSRTGPRATKKRNQTDPAHTTEAKSKNSEENAASEDRVSEAEGEAPDRDDGDWDESQETDLIDGTSAQKQRRAFTEEQIRFIITERLKKNHSFQTEKNASKRKALWEEITERLKERWPVVDQTPHQAQKRFENSVTIYKNLKKKHAGSGKPPTEWPYFRMFDAVMSPPKRSSTSNPQRDTRSPRKSAQDGRMSGSPPPVEDIYDEDGAALGSGE